MNITNYLLTEAAESMFSDAGDEMSIFDDLLLEELLQ